MPVRSILSIATLMLIGEFVFLLPFVVTRIFRPTFLKVFDISNLELGTAFSLYGVVAMIAYFFGGPIADRFSPHKLLPLAMIATAIGGVFLATIPSLVTLTLLYGLWGMTTILLFWASYVKAQRKIGGNQAQGKAFGSIDAGRGLVAALLGSGSVLLLGWFLPTEASLASLAQLQSALTKIILIFSGVTASGAVLVWLFLPKEIFEGVSLPKFSFASAKSALKKRTVWLQAFIVLCSYVGYKCTDDFSLYAHVVWGYNDVNAAHIATVSFWMRPVAAILAGLLGDYFLHSKMIICCFVVMGLGGLVLATDTIHPGMETMIIMTLAATSMGIYGLRGLYFALFQEAQIPLAITGSAAGVVSVIGYTPDVFFGPLMGWLLDRSSGVAGHQHVFLLLTVFALLGIFFSVLFRKEIKLKLPIYSNEAL